MANTGIILIYADESKDPLVQQSLTDYTLQHGDELKVYDQGIVARIDVTGDSWLHVMGGTATSITVKAATGDERDNGLVKLYDGSMTTNAIIAGDLMAFSGAVLNTATVSGTGMIYANKATLKNIDLKDTSSVNAIGGVLTNLTFNYGTSGVIDGGVTAAGLVVHKGSTLVIGSNVTLTGVISISAKLTQNDTCKASTATLNYLLTEMAQNGAALLDWQKSQFGGIALTVTDKQTAGTYTLAANAAGISVPITLNSEKYGALALSSDTGVYHDYSYHFYLNDGTMSVTVSAFQTTASASKLTWGNINDAETYTLKLTGGSGEITQKVSTQGVELLGLAKGSYTWQVSNTAEENNWQTGKNFSQSTAATEPQKLTASAKDTDHLFFAHADGVWSSPYAAKHVGSMSDGKIVWSGTGKIVQLEGKNRITDIFAGGTNASTLMLDNSENGTALFLDDVYSRAAGSAEQARLSKIDTILCTDGDDVIDLTSRQFEFDNGVTVRGGEGNDTIWANSKENMLLGGAGNDDIIGGTGNDVIGGNAGNDTLHGGGGTDTFCFGDNWGMDTVDQLNSGTVILWFKENSGTWNAAARTYTSGDNQVTVAGSAEIQLRFGATGAAARYNELLAAGAFA